MANGHTMYETVVFDLDGTLLDTLDDLTAAVNAALSAFGYPLRSRDEVRSFVGNGIRLLMERAIGKRVERFEEVLDEFKRYYGVHCADKTQAYDGILLLLSELKRRGIRTAVLSNKADFAVKKLSKAYFDELLMESIGENESAGIRKKPAPDALLAVMERLGADPKTTVYVGDSDVDIQTAKNAGVDCIAVTWGFRDEPFLRKNGASVCIDKPLELLARVSRPKFSEDKIGKTSYRALTGLKESLAFEADIFVKCEQENVGGSIKDRVAQAIIDEAERLGKLKKGGCVIEATSGNTGIGLALVAAARGYKAVIVMPDTMSVERRKMIADCGGEVVLTDGKKGMSGAVEKANELLKKTENSILADQFNNPVCAEVHYRTTAREIWAQADGKIDIFAACVGTGGTLTGIGRYLKEQNPNIQIIAIEPSASPLLSEGKAGAHGIQGIGANFIPSVLDCSVYDRVITVSDEEAFFMARTLQKTDGLFVGISSGAAVAAAVKLAKEPENKGKRIWTVLPDEGGRYLSIL